MLPDLFARGMDFITAMRARVRAALTMALERLAGCPALHAQPPDGGYYLFVRVAGCEDEEALVLRLLARGVLAHPGYFYGCQAGAHLMISCLVAPDALAQGVERVAEAAR
jgi:aspartate/methionine/tyrosine aminotransferase